MPQKRTRRRGGKRKSKRKGRKSGFPAMVPRSLMRTFKYTAFYVTSGAAPQVTKRFLSNAIWRPEVGVAKSATDFLGYQIQYSEYRVLKYRYRIWIANNEAFPVAVFITNTNADPSVSEGLTETVTELSQRKMLAAKGGRDEVTFYKQISIQRVVGSAKTVTADDDYRGLLSAGSESNPGDVTWIGIGAQSTGANLTNGITVEIMLEFDTMIYDRQILTQSDQPGPRLINGKIYTKQKEGWQLAPFSDSISPKAIYN